MDTYYGELPEPTETHENIEDHNIRPWRKSPGSDVVGICCVECGFLLID